MDFYIIAKKKVIWKMMWQSSINRGKSQVHCHRLTRGNMSVSHIFGLIAMLTLSQFFFNSFTPFRASPIDLELII